MTLHKLQTTTNINSLFSHITTISYPAPVISGNNKQHTMHKSTEIYHHSAKGQNCNMCENLVRKMHENYTYIVKRHVQLQSINSYICLQLLKTVEKLYYYYYYIHKQSISFSSIYIINFILCKNRGLTVILLSKRTS